MSEEKKYCMCGCGAEVKNKWVRGHHSRVNNVSKRADIRERRRVSMKKRHKDGIMPEVWNKGKTIESDERVKKNIQGLITEAKSEEGKLRRSNSLKKRWKEGTINLPLTGPDHPMWKGGSSAVTQRIRGSHQLYKHWKRPILKEANFQCAQCKSTENLIVHHYEERMAEIIQRFMSEHWPKMSWDEETEVVEDVIAYHLKESVSGITLCQECHEVLHMEEKNLGRHLSLSEITS